MNRKLTLLLLTAAAWAALSLNALGQATGGSVGGTVLDAFGSAVRGATVKLRDNARGQTLTTQTTDAGSFSFPNVRVGDYVLTVEAAGFSPASRDVRVALNQSASLDVTLQAAGVAASVDVTAAADSLVQTDSSQLGRSYETRQVQDLPIFGNQNQLALLAPNVVERASGVQGSGGAVGGTRPRGNGFQIDGVDNNDLSVTGPKVTVIQDAVAEFTLLSNNFNAEFGNAAGGLFNTVTRSGTNEFHGSGFIYQQSERFNASTTSEEEQIRLGNLARRPRYRDRRAGLTFGGPLLRDRLFFFGAYEHRKNDTAGAIGEYLAPTPAGLEQIAALPGASPFVVNFLRQNLTLPASATESFNVLGASVPFGAVPVLSPTGFDTHQLQLNLDHSPSTRDQFRYRFNYNRGRAEQAGGETGTADARFNNLVTFGGKLFSANWIRTVSPSVVNDLRLSYRQAPQDYPLKNEEFADFPNVFDISTNIDLGPNSLLPQGTPVDNHYQLFDTVSHVRGAHALKLGGEYRRAIVTNAFLPRARGEYIYADFDELITDAPPSILNLRGVGTQFFVGNQSSFNLFAQDDWKLTPNLTLNLGLRYEYAGLPRDSRLQALNAVSTVPGVIEFGVPETDKNNFAPRVGAAYSPEGSGRFGRLLFGRRGQSSLRANFAVSYYVNFQNLPLLSLPPQAQTELNLDAAAAAFGFDPARPFLQNGGLPGQLPPITSPALARAITQGLIPDQLSPYTLAWALSYQRELTPSTGLELRYLSTRGRRLPIQVRLNAGVEPGGLGLPTFFAEPSQAQLDALSVTLDQLVAARRNSLAAFGFLGNVTSFAPAGNSQYDSGSVSLTRRLSRGLGLTAAYTWSKTIDDSTNEVNSSAVNPRRPQDFFDLRDERGPSALDIPHRLVASFNYDVPSPYRGPSAVLRHVFGGWQINGVFQAQSGQPITPLSGPIFGLDSNLNGDTAGDRTVLNPTGREGTGSAVTPLRNSAGSVVGYLVNDPSARYVQAGPGARANAGRNTLRTPGFNRTDAVFVKNLRFGETYNLQLGAEVFDLFNQRPNTLGDDLSGLTVNTSFARVNTAFFNRFDQGNYPGRVVQLRAKFIF